MLLRNLVRQECHRALQRRSTTGGAIDVPQSCDDQIVCWQDDSVVATNLRRAERINRQGECAFAIELPHAAVFLAVPVVALLADRLLRLVQIQVDTLRYSWRPGMRPVAGWLH